MKNYVIALVVAVISVVAILASTFVDNVSVKPLPIAKTSEVQEMNQTAEGQHASAKGDSFTAGRAFSAEKASLDDREAMIGRGKQYLLTQVDNRLKLLDPFRIRVKNITTLSDSERKILVSELNAEIDTFEAFKPEINRSATKQDIRNVADKIKAEWIKSRLTVERAEEQILATTKENQLLSDADAASLGIQKRIDALKAAGKNTKNHEKLLAVYSEKIASARQDVRSAKDKFYAAASASSEDEKEKLINGKVLSLKNAQDDIRDAYKLLTKEARREFSQRYK